MMLHDKNLLVLVPSDCQQVLINDTRMNGDKEVILLAILFVPLTQFN